MTNINETNRKPDAQFGDTTHDSVSTGAINNGQSGRFGDLVYYDRRDSGPYVDGQDALEDVPEGGRLLLAPTQYFVGNEGRLATSKTLTIEGFGWRRRPDEQGTIIVNNDTAAAGAPVDNPPIEFEDPGSITEGGGIRSLYVKHTGQSPAIVVDNRQRHTIDSVAAYGLGNTDTTAGIQYPSESAFCRVQRSLVKDFDGAQIDVTDTAAGSHRLVFDTQTSSSVAGSVGVKMGGGDYVVFGQHEGDASAISMAGKCRVWGTFHEAGPNNVIEVGSVAGTNNATTSTGCLIDGIRVLPGSGSTVVRFGNSEDTTVRFPMVSNQDSLTEIYEWSSESVHDTVITRYRDYWGAGVTNSGDGSQVNIPQSLSNPQIGNLSQAVDTRVGMSNAERAPVFFSELDDQWYRTDKTGFTP